MTPGLVPLDWGMFALYFAGLSLISIGGAITTAPEMQRFLVTQHHWLSDLQFTSSIAIAQAAPGPNVLFVALIGWNAGLNTAGLAGAMLGLVVAMLCIMVPSTTLTYLAASWAHRNRELRVVRAFKQGMTPVVIALLLSTGWLLATGGKYDLGHWRLWILTAFTAVVIARTRIHLLWMLGLGALLGAFGLV